MNVTKIINWVFSIIVIFRVIPLIAFVYTVFETDPYYIKVVEFVVSIFFCLAVCLIFLLFTKLKDKRKMIATGVWFFIELMYLAHAIVALFVTDFLNTYLVMLGLMVIPFVYNLKTKRCMQRT